MPSTSVGAAKLFYLDQGRGEAVVLLHAFPLHSGMWLSQAPALAARYRVIAPDARGFGASSPAPDTLTMEMIADDTVALLDALGIQRAVIAGLSMGGYAAFALWRRYRDRVRALVLADTRASADSPQAAAGRQAFAQQALIAGMNWVADQLAAKLQRRTPLPAADRAIRTIIHDNTPAAVAAAQRGMAQRPDVTSELAGINVPTLVLVGEEDDLTPPSDATAMVHSLPHAQLVQIAGAGHLSAVEQPEAFNRVVLDFLDALPA